MGSFDRAGPGEERSVGRLKSGAVIIKAGFLSSILLYGLVGWVISSQAAEASGLPEQTRHSLSLALGVVFVVQALCAALFLPRLMRNRRNLALVQMAIYEAGALMGLVLTLLTNDPIYTAYFGVPAFVLILLTR